MRNKGFTLIELLAVIVILSLLALLAGTAVTKMIKDSKQDLYDTQLLSIKSAAQSWGAENLMQIPDAGSCRYITLSDLKEAGILEEKITDPRTNEEIPDDLIIKIQTTSSKYGKPVTTYEVDPEDLSGCLYMYDTICTPVNSATVTLGNVPSGNYDAGDEYICKVNDDTSYHFFVLSTEGDKVNLIMNSNIATTWVISSEDFNDSNDWGNGNTSKGPITAMNALYDATKEWTYVSNIKMNYTDEGGNYGGITTSGTTSITAADGTVTAVYENLKARIPNKSELVNVGCNNSTTCPAWVSANTNTYYSYWTLSSCGSNAAITYYKTANTIGCQSGINTYIAGVRPVISVLKSDIKESEPICTAVTSSTVTVGNVPSGSYTAGDEYICNVDGTNEYHFFILSKDGSKVNLIMNQDLGKAYWISSEDYNDSDNWGSGNTNKGPISAMNYLYDATKDWSNIPDITINYTDENGNYGGITTSGTTTSITKTDGTVTASYENLKARLAGKEEIDTNCTGSGNTCPSWISVNAYLYWLSASAPTSSSSYNIAYATTYYTSPNTTGYQSLNSGTVGIRPVISIPIAELK